MGGMILSLCLVSWGSQRSGEVTLPQMVPDFTKEMLTAPSSTLILAWA